MLVDQAKPENGNHQPAHQADGTENKYRPDDDELATLFAQDQFGKLAYFHGEWHQYQDGTWQAIPFEYLRHEVRIFLRKFRRGSGPYLPVSLSRRTIGAIADLAQDDLFIPDDRLKPATQYINFRNGLYNLDTHRLEPHRSDLFLTHQLDFDFDEDADAPLWRRYINSSLIDPETGKTDWALVTLLQQAVGYSLTADTSYKAAFWLVGVRDSGKSTLIAVLRSMAGSMHVTIDLNQLGNNRFLLASLPGKRIVTFTESSANGFLPDALFKALVGGSDELYVDVKNKTAITFVPEAKMWWAMNSMPRVSDRSGAVFSRLHIIPFNRTIDPDQRIPNLLELLQAERAGIFNWAMVGYRRLVNGGGQFEYCKQSEEKRQQYELENDTEGTFYRESLAPDPESMLSSSELYKEYRYWCQDNGFSAKNINQVTRDWERLGLRKTRRAEGVYWSGARFLVRNS
jgi:putative DNA primase/helicase